MSSTNALPALDPISREARRAKRTRLLGENPACLLCGLGNMDALIPAPKSLLEAHHVVGRANDGGLTVPLCRNCHAEVTEGYRDAGVPLNHPPTLLHQLVAILRALGAMLSAVGGRLAAWAEALVDLIRTLDTKLPTWRTVGAD